MALVPPFFFLSDDEFGHPARHPQLGYFNIGKPRNPRRDEPSKDIQEVDQKQS